MLSEMSVRRTLKILLGGLKSYLYKSYERRRPKYKPTESYLYLTIQLVKCIIRADALNLENYPVRTEMTGKKQILTLHVCYTEKSGLKEFLVDKTLSHICSTDKEE